MMRSLSVAIDALCTDACGDERKASQYRECVNVSLLKHFVKLYKA